MKSVNRKVLFSLLGIAVATPFLVIALVVGVRAIALADSLQGDLLVAVLALASLVASTGASIGEGRIGLRREGAHAKHVRVESESETDLRGISTLNHGY
jgi:small-conductance mechanosensitive channel